MEPPDAFCPVCGCLLNHEMGGSGGVRSGQDPAEMASQLQPTRDRGLIAQQGIGNRDTPAAPLDELGSMGPTAVWTARDDEDLRERLHQELRDDFRQQFTECNERWRAFESKAQVLLTVGGVFVAAVLTYASDRTEGLLETLLFLGALVLLLGVVVTSLAVLRVVEVPAAPLGTFNAHRVRNITSKHGEALRTYAEALVEEQVSEWQKTLTAIEDANECKCRCLWWSQAFLVGAIGATALFAMVRAF